MKILQRQKKLEKLVQLITILAVLSLIVNLLIILWIENYISLINGFSIGLFISLAFLEIIKISLVFITIFNLLKIKEFNRFFKFSILISFFIAIIFSSYFLIRFFAMACFFPLLSFVSITFSLFSSFLIIIKTKSKKAS